MRIRLSRVAVATAATAIAGLSSLIAASPAHADAMPPIDGSSCTAAQLGQVYYSDPWMNSKTIITAFTPVNVAVGTTGSHTSTLTHVANASTTETNSSGVSVTASAGFNIVLVKVSASATATYNYSTSTTIGTADTTTVSMTWNFNQPGYYGLYQGTHLVTGYEQQTTCIRNAYPSVPIGWKITTRYFQTYSPMEEGTVVCDNNIPNPILNSSTTPVSVVAKQMLGHC